MKALLELIERDGRVGRVIDLRHWPVTLGRALSNDVVLDDPFVAPEHATLALGEDGRVELQVGDSINGVLVGPIRHAAGARAALPAGGAALQLGGVRLRLRLPGETLAPERPLPAVAAAPWAPPLVAAVLLMALALGQHAISLDPGADTTAWLPVALGLPLAIAAWCGVWALASKLFQHRFDFAGHLRIVLPWLLAIELADAVLQPLAAALGWPALWRLAGPLQALLGLLMLRAQLVHVLPMAPRAVSTVVAVAALVGGGITLATALRATDRISRPAYMSTLPMPGWHWAARTDAATLVQELGPVAEGLAQRVRQARAEEDKDGEPASE